MNPQNARARALERGYSYAFELGFDGVAYLSNDSSLREFHRHYARSDSEARRFYDQGAAQAHAERVQLGMSPERFRDYQLERADQDGEQADAREDEAPAQPTAMTNNRRC